MKSISFDIETSVFVLIETKYLELQLINNYFFSNIRIITASITKFNHSQKKKSFN